MIKSLSKPLKIYCQSLKHFSYNSNLDFLYKEHFLNHKLPHFKCLSGQIEILHDPIDYYIELHKGIRDSYERICMSTLYIGNGNLEKYLVASINNKLKRSNKIKLTFLMDYFRGTRFEKNGDSSMKLLSSLKMENLHNPNIKLGFFRNPTASVISHLQTESGFREIFGTHHMKLNIFDNTILITGANLSESYFINRQDRYFLIRNCPDLANYLEELINVIVSNSYIVSENGDLIMPNDQPPPTKLKQYTNVFKQHFKLFTFSNRPTPKKFKDSFEDIFHLEKKEGKVEEEIKNYSEKYKEEEMRKELKKEEILAEKTVQENQDCLQNQEKLNEIIPTYFKENPILGKVFDEKKQAAKMLLQQSFGEGDVGNIIRKLEKNIFKNKTEESGELIDLGGNVFIFPVSQIPSIKHQEDETLIKKFINFQTKSQKNLIKIASGYMNLGPELTELIVNSQSRINLLTASPKANGFYDSGLIKSLIPYMYRVYEMNLFRILQRKDSRKVEIMEYFRGEWTFHTKGMWFYENQEETPNLTIIGSSNYSQRSYKRDNEIQFYFYSMCPKFKEKLHNENEKQFKKSHEISLSDLKNDIEVKLKWRHRILFLLLKSFL